MEWIVIVIIAVMVGIGSSVYLNQDDAPVEEAAERIIETETGIDFDLTPGSKED